MPNTGKIFISYRRSDTEGYAGRIFDRLGAHFGRQNIFMDVDTIQPGENFVEAIESAVSSCDVLIALIGDEWLTITDEDGKRRLENPHDFVRVEITAALKRGIRVIPVLLAGTEMPKARELPNDLQLMTELNALEIRHGSFDAGIEKLLQAIEMCLREINAQQQAAIVKRIPTWVWVATISGILVIGIFLLAQFRPKPTEPIASTSEVDLPIISESTAIPSQVPSFAPAFENQGVQNTATATTMATLENTPTIEVTATPTKIPTTTTFIPTEMPTETPLEPTAALPLSYGNMILGPTEIFLFHNPDSYGVNMSKLYYEDINGARFPVSMQDFIIEATFYNPYGSAVGFWDFGFMFRDTTQNGMPEEQGFSQARIVITNEVPGQDPPIEGQGYWSFYDNPKGARNLLDQGPLNNLDTREGGANHLVLIAQGKDGEVFLNGESIGTLDLSGRNQRGSVWVAISFNYGHEMRGAVTRVEDIRLWDIKTEP